MHSTRHPGDSQSDETREIVAPVPQQTRAFVASSADLAAGKEVARASATAGKSVEDLREQLRLRVRAVLPLAAGIWGTILVLGLTGIDPMYRQAVIGSGGLAVIAASVAVWVA